MIRVCDLSMPLDYTEKDLREAAAKALNIPLNEIKAFSLARRSIDARKKDQVHFICAVNLSLSGEETAVLKRSRYKKAFLAPPYHYSLPNAFLPALRPIVIGTGPAGLFAGLILAQAGARPILIERGRDVERRSRDVEEFFLTGKLNPLSNVQFGEGGAGTFSDGKLNTGTKDARARKVLEEFAAAGAPEEILFQAKPHIGTDRLRTTVKNLRRTIIALGGEVRFETQMTRLQIHGGKITGVELFGKKGTEVLETSHVILAVGHSARDTFQALLNQGVVMEQKPFSIGARIEHSQKAIDRAQYGRFAGHPALGPADYKLAVHLPNGRGVYTFCMCPGGQVVAAASEEGRLVTNGMSRFARNGENANSALLVGVTPADFASDSPLAGVEYQRRLEEAAYRLGGGSYRAPAQLAGDFLKKQPTSAFGSVVPSYQPGVTPASLDQCLPPEIADAMRQGLRLMDAKLHGFAQADAVLTGVETRSSSPVRIPRTETLEAVGLQGLYPCGEGAGYAGGIVSAAVDGIRCAEAVLRPVR